MENVAGVILAGGLSRRMNGPEKSTVLLQGKTFLQHVIERVSPQVSKLVLNANGSPERFSDTNLPIVADEVPEHPGPLAGVLAGMNWVNNNASGMDWILSVPCDTPILPSDLSQRFIKAAEEEGADIVMAGSDNRIHPVVGLWRVHLIDDLRKAIVDEEIRKVRAFSDRYKTTIVEWPVTPNDPFSNINTPEELETAKKWFE